MTVAIKSLSLIIPGLLDETDPEAQRNQIRQQTALGRLLDRADISQVDTSGLENTLIQMIAGDSLAVSHAWLTRQAELDDLPAQRAWLRADPVYMQADRDNIVLFGAQALAIQQEEADSLIAELNATYAELDWVFEAADPLRWYLHIPASPRIQCTPLADMVGRNVRDRMPEGEDRLFWHRTLNEIQMLFYQSPVNLARREAGVSEINSVWLWGNGEQELPLLKQDRANLTHLWGQDVLLHGLAIASDTRIKPLPEHANAWLDSEPSGDHLVLLPEILQGSGRETERSTILQQYEQDWFAPLLAILRSRQIDVVEIWPCNGMVYRVTRGMLLRFWRKNGWQKTVTST